MSEVTLSSPALKTEENDEAAIEAYWTELMDLRRQIDAEQAEIDRLKTETQWMLTQLKSTVGI